MPVQAGTPTAVASAEVYTCRLGIEGHSVRAARTTVKWRAPRRQLATEAQWPRSGRVFRIFARAESANQPIPLLRTQSSSLAERGPSHYSSDFHGRQGSEQQVV